VAQFDIYRHQDGRGYLLDLQSNLIDALQTRVVIPLLPPSEVPQPISNLHPTFEVEGERFVLATQLLGAVPRRRLGKSCQ
jgi:toxin CcdB